MKSSTVTLTGSDFSEKGLKNRHLALYRWKIMTNATRGRLNDGRQEKKNGKTQGRLIANAV